MSSKYLDRVNEIINRTPGKAIQIKSVEEAGKYIDKEKFASVIKTTFDELKDWFSKQGITDFSKKTSVYYYPDDNVISIDINGFCNKDGKQLDHSVKRKIGANGSNYQEYNNSTVINQTKYNDFSPELDMQMTLGDPKIPTIGLTPFPSGNPLDTNINPFDRILRS